MLHVACSTLDVPRWMLADAPCMLLATHWSIRYLARNLLLLRAQHDRVAVLLAVRIAVHDTVQHRALARLRMRILRPDRIHLRSTYCSTHSLNRATAGATTARMCRTSLAHGVLWHAVVRRTGSPAHGLVHCHSTHSTEQT